MTIANTTSKVSYNGSGSTGPFPITFKFTKNADIVATKRSSAGVETTLALTTDYTLTGAGDASGGALTLVVALAVGESLVIARVPWIVQEVDYVENSAFPAETHEGALDLLTMICQSLQEQIDRAVKVEISSTTSPDDLLAEIAVDVAGAAAAVDAAETAQGLAEDARDAAETAQGLAEDARDAAEEAEAGAEAVLATAVKVDVFTAAWDFLVGSGPATYVKKTVQEVWSYITGNFAGRYTNPQQAQSIPIATVSGVLNLDALLHQEVRLESTGQYDGATLSIPVPINGVAGEVISVTGWSGNAAGTTLSFDTNILGTKPDVLQYGKWSTFSMKCIGPTSWIFLGFAEAE